MSARALAEIVIDFIPLPGGATVFKVLMNIRDLCKEAGDAQEACLDLHERLLEIFKHLERMEKNGGLNSPAVTGFTKTLNEYWHQLHAYQEMTVVQRMLHHRKMKKAVASIEGQVEQLFKMVGLATADVMVGWRRKFEDSMAAQEQQLALLVGNTTELLEELRGRELLDTMVLLKAAIDKINAGTSDLPVAAHGAVRSALRDVVQEADIEVQPTPAWFVPESDVTFDEAPFARGSFATVHRGTFGAQTPVVVKIMLADEGGLDETLQRSFRNEADVWYRLRHPNVVQMFGACHVTSRPFIVSENAANGSMNEFLSKDPSHGKYAWRLLLESAQGLAHLHSVGIVHGDVRLANVLVSSDITAKLSDFGLSRVKNKSKSKSMTKRKDGEVVEGNWRWTAPEAHTFKPQFASDVFGLAMSIFEAYTGEPPFAGVRSEKEVKEKILAGERPPRPAGMSNRAWELILDMTKRDPTTRISIDAVVARLRELVEANEPAPPTSVVDAPAVPAHAIAPSVDVQQLLATLRDGSEPEKLQAATHLGALSGNEDIARQLVAPLSVSVVLNALQDGPESLKEHLVVTVHNIALGAQESQLIGMRGGIAVLAELLMSPRNPLVRRSALKALVRLAVTDKMNAMMFVSARGVAAVEGLLTTSSPNERVEVIQQLGDIVSSSDAIATAVAASSAILNTCLSHVHSKHDDERRAADRVLSELVRREAAVRAIHRSVGFKALMDAAQNGSNVHVREAILGALTTLLGQSQPDEERAP